MSIEALKEKARGHEQREEWQKALSLYLEAIQKLDEAEEPDISLYNRVGDLEIRLGQTDEAVEHYERAVDLYEESELPNNAIAICKKVVRNVPERHSIYLKMGQIRANQGFLTDARQNFLTYAEQKQAEEDIEAALDALIEFVALAPEDLEIRLALAEQLEQHGRTDEAVEQYREVHRRLIQKGRSAEAADVEASLEALAPGLELDDAEVGIGAEAGEPSGDSAEIAPGSQDEDLFGGGGDEGWAGSFQEIDLEGPEVEPEAEDAEEEEAEKEDEFEIDGLESSEIDAGDDEEEERPSLEGKEPADEAIEGAVEEEPSSPSPLPTFGYGGDEEEEEEEVEELGVTEDDLEDLSWNEEEPTEAREDAIEEAAGEIEWAPMEPEKPREEAEEDLELPAEAGEHPEEIEGPEYEGLARAGRLEEAVEALEEEIAIRPAEIELRKRMVEFAFRSRRDDLLVEAYLGLAEALRREGSGDRARAVYAQVLETDPGNAEALRALSEGAEEDEEEPASASGAEVASSEEYVDLGSLILDEEEEEKSTRFVVAAETPSGDESADFARMLDQFKEKVAANVSVDDVAAHYDLGTAYKEMGLVEEAIGEFQAALRARRDHLPTYEMLGQCFMEQNEPEMAARTLRRALDVPHEVEDELVGIYYYLGRAYEELGERDGARSFYEKVFELDINFRDVTERLRGLR